MPETSFLQGKNTVKTYYLKNKLTTKKPQVSALNQGHRTTIAEKSNHAVESYGQPTDTLSAKYDFLTYNLIQCPERFPATLDESGY